MNGNVIAVHNEASVPEPNTQDLVFGQSACSDCGYERWHGLIDDIRVYNRVLSTAEIQADMNTGI